MSSTFEAAKPDVNAGGFPRWLIPIAVLLVIVFGVYQLYYAPQIQKSMVGGLVVDEARAITTAIELYELEYGKLPGPWGSVEGDVERTTEGILLRALIGADEKYNPSNRRFYGPSPSVALWSGFSKDEHSNEVKLVDPWERAFVVVLDYDGDGVVKHPDTGEEFRASCIAFSKGEDADSPEDDLGSWAAMGVTP